MTTTVITQLERTGTKHIEDLLSYLQDADVGQKDITLMLTKNEFDLVVDALEFQKEMINI